MKHVYELGEYNDTTFQHNLQFHIEQIISEYEKIYSIFSGPVISSRVYDTYLQILDCVRNIIMSNKTESMESEVSYFLQSNRIVFSIYRETNNIFILRVSVCDNSIYIKKRRAAMQLSPNNKKKPKIG